MQITFLTKIFRQEINEGAYKHAYQLINRISKKENVRIISGRSTSFIGKMLFDLVELPFRLLLVKSDVYHAMLHEEAIWSVILRKRPLITNIYDVLPLTCKKESRFITSLYFWMACQFAKRSDLIITCSEYSKGEIIKALKISPDKVQVIPIGFDLNRFKPSKNKKNGKNIGYVGSFRTRKNVHLIIKSLPYLKKKIPDCKLFIAGRGDTSSLESLAKQLRVSDMVSFLGYVSEEELPAFYNSIDVFVFPSEYEGFGMPLVEAMACGVPVITSNKSSLPEVVGDAGMSIEPNGENIAKAIIKVLTNKELMKSMSRKGIKKAKSFDWDNVIKKNLEKYREVQKINKHIK